MTPEGKIKHWASETLKRLLPGANLYRPPGGAYGKAGEPDIQVAFGGCLGVIEAKVADGEPTPLQWKRLRDYSKAGVLAMVLRGRDQQRLEFFAKLLKERAECLKLIIGQQNQA